MLAYSSLITKASIDYWGEAWLGYDKFFRQQAAAEPARYPQWGEIDASIWTQHFSSATVRPSCPDCGSREHRRCPATQDERGTRGAGHGRRWEARQKPYPTKPICRRFNRGQSCNPAQCSYRHVCQECKEVHPVTECPQLGPEKEGKGKQRAEGGKGKNPEAHPFRWKGN